VPDKLVSDQVDELETQLLLEAIYQRYRYDFRSYAIGSILRRVKLAQQWFKCGTISQLQDRVLHDPSVLPQLLSYLTIQVSVLFRDPHYFLSLRENVIPHLRTYPSLKVWVPGCATGEEVYSLVILFREEGLASRTLFYGTDINGEALKKAEAGKYDLDRIRLFTRNHRQSGGKTSLSDYYTAAYGAAVFDKSLRDQVVFSDHSLATDDVFAEVHLISCRNVLIYFQKELQDRAIKLFSESQPRHGFLGLGAKESLRFSRCSSMYAPFDRTAKIYRRTGES
jgi:chemotaxis protein methyltransferase CheR